MPDYLQDLGDGVYAIDTGFQRPLFDAAYLIVEDGRAAFIDTGTNHAVPRLLGALEYLGLRPEQVDWVIPTHVHLDHAGGVGLLMQSLPQARVAVHPRGARHMIDPAALYQGALAVYGEEEMQRSYGTLVGVDAARVLSTSDGLQLELGGRPLLFADTPGHARHHHCIWDERSRSWFTGDTFGLSYREFDTAKGPWIIPTSTPVQFDPEALRTSIARMMRQGPLHMQLTHYGRISDLPRLSELLLEHLDATVAIGLAQLDAPDRHASIKQDLALLYRRSLRAHGCLLAEACIDDLLAMDVELNAQGLGIWLDRDKTT
ncbi:MBL fold metallo-hydrolase [Roseateles toxinivorans]|uniref:Glyoxylase-like metal-dependent hydrolase (Beta-lactamase superfamily II) n=1 Tax=Roseateles toxinivorans TaxID=270368 RepID=A0A4R6QM18_9BURK|nr:MBL fold metallo-hydrolase [Roseateles toxinivorans]TDP63918.1 glyoxylase-like metal-dependent hydrolase (beta-lactamase superfamily II) [Roseateles toxinivorans]